METSKLKETGDRWRGDRGITGSFQTVPHVGKCAVIKVKEALCIEVVRITGTQLTVKQ